MDTEGVSGLKMLAAVGDFAQRSGEPLDEDMLDKQLITTTAIRKCAAGLGAYIQIAAICFCRWTQESDGGKPPRSPLGAGRAHNPAEASKAFIPRLGNKLTDDEEETEDKEAAKQDVSFDADDIAAARATVLKVLRQQNETPEQPLAVREAYE
ncbi:hypothetical protein GLAREA_10094 [Glarea lozoyensis ATCC 20868]|uniref:Uncharacterized protein n=1 Tax=Glarea lozoyensis (strain ATCC 20868 / MF5171) TaxID=1116229 RepID=S3D9J3_GLAL2|nr:uncharacterized protein GLAREA_10094 [Glarea lozoyensis ATCC 20868]EPE34400.1 hypothetical protein GLAREA_10094 [Glarea lozoyensis ATCC 20868]